MKSLKVIIAAVALSLAVSVPAQAQKKGGMSPEQQIQAIETQVGSLTDAQKEKINAIIAKTRDEMKQVPKDQKKEKGPEMMKKQREEIAAVLTPEQREKFQAAAKKGGNGGKKKKGSDN